MKHQMKICDGKINFCCKMNACKHSCCGPFNGISDELKSVENRPFDEIVLTEEDYRRLCDNGCEHFACEAFSPLNGKKYYKMDLAEDGTCKALINGKCSIHDINPTLCKAFPFCNSASVGHFSDFTTLIIGLPVLIYSNTLLGS